MEPTTIAAQLREIAVYFDLDGDRHRAIAYDRAAKSIEAAKGLHRLLDEGKLEELPYVGSSIARVVGDLARRGSSTVLEKLRAKWPAVIVELAQLPSIGVQKARKIHEALAPADLDAVAAACKAHAVRTIPGFGELSEKKILKAIEERRTRGTREIHIDAEQHANSLAGYLRASDAATRVEVAGQVRRWCEIVEHIAIAVETEHRDVVTDRLANYGLITSVERDDTVVSARLSDGMRCEVHFAPRARFGWALICATGSPEHVEQLKSRAQARGVDVTTLVAPEEADVYKALGLPWLPPEVRDATDELAAADAGDDFTDLIELADVTTAFHCHTTYSDGKDSIEAMARAAAALGMKAITITDHSAAASYAGGLDAQKLRDQHAEMAGLHDLPVRLFRGTEADILADGSIDVPMEIVPELDVVIASVHQRYKANEDEMTKRLVTTMRQPFFKIWGHALGRLVLRRDPIAVRLDEVLDAIAESPAAIEINGDPYRLDLDPINARKAAARGIPFVLSSDAHSVKGIEAVRWAVAMARRARIRKRQVLNALPPELLAERIRPLAPGTAARS
ncbi:MAG: PHP domain-containing protein [Kofleriaceae bacterium]|nr:PHP domain-containing protein [Kofleriaceae bacterium]